MRIIKILAMGCLVALSGVALRADILELGGTYSSVPFYDNSTNSVVTEGGGSIDTSYLNGTLLPYVFCVDLYTAVYVPGTYNQTVVTNDGKIRDTAVTNASQIAYLLQQYATGGQGDAAVALQAAIWHVEGYGNLADSASQHQKDLYNLYLTNIGTGDISQFQWMSPAPGVNQGLVTHVPDGGTTLVLLGGALVALQSLRRRLGA